MADGHPTLSPRRIPTLVEDVDDFEELLLELLERLALRLRQQTCALTLARLTLDTSFSQA